MLDIKTEKVNDNNIHKFIINHKYQLLYPYIEYIYMNYGILIIIVLIIIILLLILINSGIILDQMESVSPTHEIIEWPKDNTIVGESFGVLAGVWKNGNLIHKIEYGYADIINNEKMHWNMHGRIGSVTKTFTCSIILMLIDKGLLSLDDEARKYLNYVPSNITIRQLGNMTSGIYNYSLEDKFNDTLDEFPNKVWNVDELVSIGLEHDPFFMPGKGWSYSNTNTILLGLIAEKVTGTSIDQLYNNMIFKKLGLKNTQLPKNNKLSYPYANGYMYGYNNNKKNITNIVRDVTHDNPSWAWTAGELISTINDLHIYIRSLVEGTLLSDKTKKLRETTFVKLDALDYGFGLFRINDEWYGHNGQIPGYQTFAVHSLKRDMTIIIMCNLSATSKGEEPADAVGRKLIEFITTNNI